VKWSEVLSNSVSIIIRRYTYIHTCTSYELCSLYGRFVYHNLLYFYGSIVYHFLCVCIFWMFMFNVVNCVLLLLCIVIVSLWFLVFIYVPFWVLFRLLFSVLFVCKCVLYYCHRVATQLQLTNISYDIICNCKLTVLLNLIPLYPKYQYCTFVCLKKYNVNDGTSKRFFKNASICILNWVHNFMFVAAIIYF